MCNELHVPEHEYFDRRLPEKSDPERIDLNVPVVYMMCNKYPLESLHRDSTVVAENNHINGHYEY